MIRGDIGTINHCSSYEKVRYMKLRERSLLAFKEHNTVNAILWMIQPKTFK